MYSIRPAQWLLLAAMLLFGTNAMALQAVVDHAVFYRVSPVGTDSAVVEVYWQVDPASLHYHRDPNRLLTASIRAELSITGPGGAILASDKHVFNTRPLPDTIAASNLIVELHRFTIPPVSGQLHLRLGEEGFPAKDFNFTDSVLAAQPSRPWYSSVQLLDTLYESNAQTSFLINGRQRIPRFLNFFDEGQHRLLAYFELYRPDAIPANNYPLTQTFYITAKTGQEPIFPYIVRDTIGQRATYLQFFKSFNINRLSSGNYYLRAELKNKFGNIIATSATFFQTFNNHPEAGTLHKADTTTTGAPEKVTVFDLNKTFIAKYTVPQLRAMLKMITPVASPDEVLTINGFLRKPDDLYMRYFLYNFFSSRGKDPAVAWKNYSDTIRYVNREFSGGGVMGYETDRGLIYLKYGPPEERIPVPHEAGAQPYELWLYNSSGRRHEQGIFLFYQPGYAGGNMVLLHSTVAGERRNEAWRGVLFGTSQSTTSNSRAEQYIGDR